MLDAYDGINSSSYQKVNIHWKRGAQKEFRLRPL